MVGDEHLPTLHLEELADGQFGRLDAALHRALVTDTFVPVFVDEPADDVRAVGVQSGERVLRLRRQVDDLALSIAGLISGLGGLRLRLHLSLRLACSDGALHRSRDDAAPLSGHPLAALLADLDKVLLEELESLPAGVLVSEHALEPLFHLAAPIADRQVRPVLRLAVVGIAPRDLQGQALQLGIEHQVLPRAVEHDRDRDLGAATGGVAARTGGRGWRDIAILIGLIGCGPFLATSLFFLLELLLTLELPVLTARLPALMAALLFKLIFRDLGLLDGGSGCFIGSDGRLAVGCGQRTPGLGWGCDDRGGTNAGCFFVHLNELAELCWSCVIGLTVICGRRVCGRRDKRRDAHTSRCIL
ncbi:hypothetical protein B5807_08654 [Epicoccum nigrum]|uniref:Uncharacterized protein n=1 Tax=Epicoccum nigrum TaxID=105696 RepID=A0A1Y2LQX7_EPING|nr:hypothetical protein B5807_08654 [Epicoccum nigrum]